MFGGLKLPSLKKMLGLLITSFEFEVPIRVLLPIPGEDRLNTGVLEGKLAGSNKKISYKLGLIEGIVKISWSHPRPCIISCNIVALNGMPLGTVV